jgi:hypothetical protein
MFSKPDIPGGHKALPCIKLNFLWRLQCGARVIPARDNFDPEIVMGIPKISKLQGAGFIPPV